MVKRVGDKGRKKKGKLMGMRGTGSYVQALH